MDLNNTPGLAECRHRVRWWFAEHAGEGPRLGDVPARLEWQRERAGAVTWPAEYGRRGGEVRHRFGEIAVAFLALRFYERFRAAA